MDLCPNTYFFMRWINEIKDQTQHAWWLANPGSLSLTGEADLDTQSAFWPAPSTNLPLKKKLSKRVHTRPNWKSNKIKTRKQKGTLCHRWYARWGFEASSTRRSQFWWKNLLTARCGDVSRCLLDVCPRTVGGSGAAVFYWYSSFFFKKNVFKISLEIQKDRAVNWFPIITACRVLDSKGSFYAIQHVIS